MAWFAMFILINIHQVSKSMQHNIQLPKSSQTLPVKRELSEFCDKDWFPFGNKCYKVGGKKTIGRVNWETAAERCSRDGGTLATIYSKELQEFLVAYFVLAVKKDVWIGLNDRANESSYVWADGSEFNYTKWAPTEPRGPIDEKEDCVEMFFTAGQGDIGDWNDVDCNNHNPYICQTDKVKRMKEPENPMFCSSEDNGGWKFGKSCFNIVADRKSWVDAEAHCQKAYQGHLATIKDFVIEGFLDYVLRNFSGEFWIGIQIREEWQQKWVSGWHVTYSAWEKGKKEFVHGTCVVRIKKNQWSTVPCSRKFAFICEKSGISPPTLKASVENAVCPREPIDWRDLDGDYCYYFETTSHATWADANFQCLRRGGHLASIHSQLENDVIHPFIESAKPAVFIGLYRSRPKDEEFAWADGSPMDFLFWDTNEPNSEEEHCAEMRTESQKWNDIYCHDKRGYICSVRKIPPNTTSENSPIPPVSPNKTTGTSSTAAENPEISCPGGFSLKALIAVSVSSFLVAILLAVVIYYFRRERELAARKSSAAPVIMNAIGDKHRFRSEEIVIREDSLYEIMH